MRAGNDKFDGQLRLYRIPVRVFWDKPTAAREDFGSPCPFHFHQRNRVLRARILYWKELILK